MNLSRGRLWREKSADWTEPTSRTIRVLKCSANKQHQNNHPSLLLFINKFALLCKFLSSWPLLCSKELRPPVTCVLCGWPRSNTCTHRDGHPVEALISIFGLCLFARELTTLINSYSHSRGLSVSEIRDQPAITAIIIKRRAVCAGVIRWGGMGATNFSCLPV